MKNEIKKPEEHTPVCRVCYGHCWKEKINEARIAEILGEASMAWSETPKGIFNSTKVVELLDEIKEMFNKP